MIKTMTTYVARRGKYYDVIDKKFDCPALFSDALLEESALVSQMTLEVLKKMSVFESVVKECKFQCYIYAFLSMIKKNCYCLSN
jgi:hypothetical protein